MFLSKNNYRAFFVMNWKPPGHMPPRPGVVLGMLPDYSRHCRVGSLTAMKNRESIQIVIIGAQMSAIITMNHVRLDSQLFLLPHGLFIPVE